MNLFSFRLVSGSDAFTVFFFTSWKPLDGKDMIYVLKVINYCRGVRSTIKCTSGMQGCKLDIKTQSYCHICWYAMPYIDLKVDMITFFRKVWWGGWRSKNEARSGQISKNCFNFVFEVYIKFAFIVRPWKGTCRLIPFSHANVVFKNIETPAISYQKHVFLSGTNWSVIETLKK